MSTTPRTDALQDELLHADAYTCCQEFQKLAMKLERELANEREKSERYRLASLKLDVELVAMKARAEHAEAAERYAGELAVAVDAAWDAAWDAQADQLLKMIPNPFFQGGRK